VIATGAFKPTAATEQQVLAGPAQTQGK